MTDHEQGHEQDQGPDPADPLAEQAVRLVGAVQDWARQTFPAPPSGHGGPECQWCPLCQFAAVLRGERPEVSERVAVAGTAIASAFRALLDATSQAAAQAATQPTPKPTGKPAAASSTGGVEHIDLGGRDESAGDAAETPRP